MTTIRPTTPLRVSDQDVTLTSPFLRVRTAPRYGAKLTELRSLRSGRDWLWRNPRQMMRQGKPFADYVGEFDTGGWDELFPTVSPVAAGTALGHWGAEGLTDHGELWYRAWETDQPAPRHCTQRVESPSDSFRFARTLRLDRLSARADLLYAVENTGSTPMPFVWAAHPLFRCEPGMSIEIDPDTELEALQWHGEQADGAAGCCRRWGDLLDRFPFLAGGDGWSGRDVRCGLTLKVFLRTGADERVSLVDRASRERLSLWHGGGAVTHTAIWLNLGGWSGDRGTRHRNIGIEPTTFPADEPPIDAVAATRLEAGERREWSLSFSIDRLSPGIV